MSQGVQYYPTAADQWPDSPAIVVFDRSGQRLCTIPLHFLTASETDPLALLVRIVQMCVVQDGVLTDAAGTRIVRSDQMTAGRLLWECASEYLHRFERSAILLTQAYRFIRPLMHLQKRSTFQVRSASTRTRRGNKHYE